MRDYHSARRTLRRIIRTGETIENSPDRYETKPWQEEQKNFSLIVLASAARYSMHPIRRNDLPRGLLMSCCDRVLIEDYIERMREYSERFNQLNNSYGHAGERAA